MYILTTVFRRPRPRGDRPACCSVMQRERGRRNDLHRLPLCVKANVAGPLHLRGPPELMSRRGFLIVPVASVIPSLLCISFVVLTIWSKRSDRATRTAEDNGLHAHTRAQLRTTLPESRHPAIATVETTHSTLRPESGHKRSIRWTGQTPRSSFALHRHSRRSC